jgi:hypothetical protein
MAKNTGDSSRKGAVKNSSQYKNTKTGTYIKKNNTTGKIVGNKTTGGKFKGVTDKSKKK